MSNSRTKKLATDLEGVPVLVERQLTLDKERTKRLPELFAHKLRRMSASPLAFLRGAAPLFYEILASSKDLSEGPPGEGHIVGDLHLENFGAYRPDVFAELTAGKKHAANFNLNDFDDTVVAPWRLDVLRFMTSLLLGGRELGASGLVALELVDHMFEAWEDAAFDGRPPPAPPAPVETLLEQVRSRTRTQLLDARTELALGTRRFVRGPRYADLSKEIQAAVPRAFEDYIASIPDAERPQKGSLAIIDAALRIAGTGSLGGLRIAVLVEGKGGPNGAWIFDLIEQGTPSAAVLFGEPPDDPATRVMTGFRTCIEHPPRIMGTTRLGKLSMFGRRLAPQEDKLDLRRLRGDDLPALATYLGALLGTAHRRGATKPPSKRWSKSDRNTIRAQAITLAGVHEAVYLALCERIRPIVAS
ncbi:MAG TPA: DUF2252 family protein [Labilithrix sp.]|nr:DUF2252 family protein [Labilithrix sp.]